MPALPPLARVVRLEPLAAKKAAEAAHEELMKGSEITFTVSEGSTRVPAIQPLCRCSLKPAGQINTTDADTASSSTSSCKEGAKARFVALESITARMEEEERRARTVHYTDQPSMEHPISANVSQAHTEAIPPHASSFKAVKALAPFLTLCLNQLSHRISIATFKELGENRYNLYTSL